MISLGSNNIKGLRIGTRKINKAYLGSNLIWESKSWVLVKKGKIGFYYDSNWTFKVNIGQKIRVTLTKGDSFKADVIASNDSNNVTEYSSSDVWSYEATLYDVEVKIYGSTADVIVEIYK